MTERRRFLSKAGGLMAVAAAATIADAPHVIAQPKVRWRMSTTWSQALDVNQGAAQRLAKIVEETSGGRFRIEVFPAGQIMPAFDCFEAASKGTIEAFMGAAYYWTTQGREPALRELKKFAGEVVKEESEKSPMARKVHASFTKFQTLLAPWDHVAEGAYHQLVAG
jgi:TRAP-type mannitol/chloroaromatic compound transport system substrate-binding protein